MATTVFKKKKQFQKSYQVINTKDDWGMEQEHQFAFWNDPSQSLVVDALDLFALQGDDEALDKLEPAKKEELNDRFYNFCAEVIIDCDIEGADFTNAETARKTFNDPRVDYNFFYLVIIRYFTDILARANALKKTMAYIEKISNSGASKSEKEEK